MWSPVAKAIGLFSIGGIGTGFPLLILVVNGLGGLPAGQDGPTNWLGHLCCRGEDII